MDVNNENFIFYLEFNELNNVFFRELYYSIRIFSGKGGFVYGCCIKNLN